MTFFGDHVVRVWLSIVLFGGWIAVGLAPGAQLSAAPRNEYRWNDGEEFAYRFHIVADLGDQTQHVKGITVYRPVRISARQHSDKSGKGTGSAFVVHPDGYLVTCAHVVRDAAQVDIQLGGKRYPARVVATDQARDVAVLRIAARDLAVLPLSPTPAQLALEVRAFGFPLSDVLGDSIKISRGSIAGFLGRPAGQMLQVDASINPGNSGGPLVNNRGEVVGLASAKLAGHNVNNIGFGVPVASIGPLLKQRGIAFQSTGAPQALSGPELARRVTPAVAMVTVSISSATANVPVQYALGVRGRVESYRRRPDGSVIDRPVVTNIDSARVTIDASGRAFELQNTAALPFALGSQALVGIERWPETDTSSWTVRAAARLSKLVPNVPAHFPELDRIVFPVLEETTYEIRAPLPDGTVPIRKRYLVRSARKSDAALTMLGTGTVFYDPQARLPRRLDFTATIAMSSGNKRHSIPLKYRYEQADPRLLGNKVLVARDGQGTAGQEGAPSQRKPVPDKAARDNAAKLIDQLFEEEAAKAVEPEKKVELAEKMYRFAAEEKDLANRFALLDAARRMAADAGDLEMAMKSAAALSKLFDIDAERLEISTLTSVGQSAKAKAQQEAVARRAYELMNAALDDEQFDVATRMGALSLKSARAAENFALIKLLTKRGREMKELRAVIEKVQAAKKVLEKSPTDAAANLEVGRYYCFYKGVWSRGVSMLALGSDADLQEIATSELAAPKEAEAQAALGDRWWELADAAEEQRAADSMRRRAEVWYRKALPSLAGLNRLQIEKRLKEVPPEQVASTDLPEAAPADDADGPAKSDGGSKPSLSSLRGKSSSAIRKRLIAHAADAIANGQTVKSNVVGWKLGTRPFTLIPPSGSLLVGLDISIGSFDKINSIRPVFYTSKGVVPGPVYGVVTRKAGQIRARKGYAIGAVTVKGGIGIDGLGVTFMAIEDGALDPQKSYTSAWFGRRGRMEKLGGDGSLIVGIQGHVDEKRVTAIGVVTAPKAN